MFVKVHVPIKGYPVFKGLSNQKLHDKEKCLQITGLSIDLELKFDSALGIFLLKFGWKKNLIYLQEMMLTFNPKFLWHYSYQNQRKQINVRDILQLVEGAP